MRVDVNKSLPRFIELVLAPQERSGSDSAEMQRLAIESLREARPGMLIDHIEEPTQGAGPIKSQPMFMRLRSHAEARTFDELRVFELGRLVRVGDPDWHSSMVELVYQARAILVDTTGLVADPANDGDGRSERQRVKQAQRSSRSATTARPAAPASPGAPPPARPSTSPIWGDSPQQDRAPSIDLPKAPGPRELGIPAPTHIATSPSTPPPPRRGVRFFALCEGRLFCPTCAQPMTIQSMGHDRRVYYTCASKHLHPASDSQPEVFYPVDAVDEGVWTHFTTMLPDPQHALTVLRDAEVKGAAVGQSRKAQTQGRLERLEKDELEVLSLRSEDRISEGAARHRLDEIRVERRKLENDLGSDSGDDNKLDVICRVLQDLANYKERSTQDLCQADYGLRRRVVEACIPPSAAYGVFPHPDGMLEIRDVLQEHDFTPGLKDRARSLGRFAGGLKDRVAAARPDASTGLSERLAGIAERLPFRKQQQAAESTDLGKALQASVHEHQPVQLQSTPPRRTSWPAYIFLLVAAGMVAILFQPVAPDAHEYEDQTSLQGLDEQLSQLHEVPGGWIGITRSDWAGSTDPKAAEDLCMSMAGRFELGVAETITLMVPGGLPIAECRPQRQPGAANRASSEEG